MRISPRRRSGAVAGNSSAGRRSSKSSSPSSLIPSMSGTVASIFALAALAPSPANAFNFTPVPSANLDLSSLGRIGIVGNFTGVSLFQFEEQAQNSIAANSSESLLARLPNSAFANVLTTDASIMTMCAFVRNSSTNASVVLGGNFTSLGSQEATAIALFNPNTSVVTPMPGISGQVNAVLCDEDTDSVYVGGTFIGLNSTNAIRWDGSAGWTALPFSGFNGPVSSIVKAANGNIIFGGSFTGLGNASTPIAEDEQVVNIGSASIEATGSSNTTGFSDPSNIVCKTNGTDGQGETWLLEDDTPGSWQASFGFGFQPSKLRLWNTHLDGRGTKTFRFTALPLGGILNLTYIDPTDGSNNTCTSECPLAFNTTGGFQDFFFVNNVGMNAFRIDISAWYGAGGGLDGIELFENDIFAYAINGFNEPSCAVSATEVSTSTQTGPWTVSPSFQSNSKYLTAQLSSPIFASNASVVFSPDIRQAGNYSVNMYTPGCLQDDTCATRGQVNITVSMSADQKPTSVQLYQTNNFDKYDQIYFGSVDEPSSSFRPTVTLTPLSGQSLQNMTIVAQRVGFTLLNSTGGLNGLYEYNPEASTVSMSDFSDSAFDTLGSDFTSSAVVNALATGGDVTYIAGNFTSSTASYIVSVNAKSSKVETLSGSLNNIVSSMVLNDTKLFVGGTFTASGSVTGLNRVAVYDTSANTWSPLGAGVDGPVVKVVGMTMNVTDTTPEFVVAFTGGFRTLLAYEDNAAVSVDGFAIWVPSQKTWLQHANGTHASIDGVLFSSLLEVPGVDGPLYGGSLSYSQIGANGAATLSSAGVGSFGTDILSAATTDASGQTKRDTSSSVSIAGVNTGVFDTTNSRNITILGGHFTANTSSGALIQNLLIIDNKNDGAVSGIDSGDDVVDESSTFTTMAVLGNTLYAGGNVTGTINKNTINGMVSYNLADDKFNTQPPSLNGGNGTVTAIRVRPNTNDLYVGGTFATAGSLGCPGVCLFTSAGQWNRPGTNLGTSTVNTMLWTTASTLVAGGSLVVNNTVSTVLATYYAGIQVWDTFAGGTDVIPGPVEVLAAGSSDGSELWVSGTATNGSLYLMKYDGKTWADAFSVSGTSLSAGTNIRSLQVFSVTTNHDATTLLDDDQILMLTGTIVIPGFGTASAAVFNGKTFVPFALTPTNADDNSGSIASIFVENSNFFTTRSHKHLPLVAVVLIGLGISLVLMLVIVAAGLLLDRYRKKQQGYLPAPTAYADDKSRIPPQELLENLQRGRPDLPQL